MSPDRILKRYFPALALLLISCVAYLQARGVVRLLALALDLDRVSALPPKPATKPPATKPHKSGQAIVDRNPFDSTTGTLAGQGCRGDSSATTADASDPLSWPLCPDVRVVIVTESRDPFWSLATLQSVGEPPLRARRVGDSIASKQIAFIGYNPREQAPAVWLQGNGTLCQTLLFQREQEPAALPVVVPAPASDRRASFALLRTVRIVPEQKNGKLVGLRLFGIKPSSLLGTLGLMNGDRLESINGFDVANPSKALEAYARLRTATRLHVRLHRSGQPVELDLNII
jgi:general secretion pathway protein C